MASFHIPASWDTNLVGAVTMIKSRLAVIPDDETPKADRGPAFPIPEDITIRLQDVERVKFDDLDDSKAKDKGDKVPCEWVEPANGGSGLPVLLYFHGGGFWGSSPEEHRMITVPMVSHSNAGLRLFAVDYRLSPANPFPSALIDALSAYRYLVQNEKISPDTIFFGGDSAGGNLATSTAIYLRDCPALGFGTPKGLVLISPWIDLHRSSPTLSLNDEFTACLLEFIKVGETLEEPPALPYIKHAIGMKHTDPLVSPIYDDGKLPAMMIAVGTVDRFLGECLAQGIKQVGKGDVVVMDYVEDQVHVFQMFGWLPQTSTYFARANAFIKDLSSGAISTSVSYISADGRVKDLAKGAEDSVKEQKKRLRGYLERQQKDGLDKGAWKRTAFYRSLAE